MNYETNSENTFDEVVLQASTDDAGLDTLPREALKFSNGVTITPEELQLNPELTAKLLALKEADAKWSQGLAKLKSDNVKLAEELALAKKSQPATNPASQPVYNQVDLELRNWNLSTMIRSKYAESRNKMVLRFGAKTIDAIDDVLKPTIDKLIAELKVEINFETLYEGAFNKLLTDPSEKGAAVFQAFNEFKGGKTQEQKDHEKVLAEQLAIINNKSFGTTGIQGGTSVLNTNQDGSDIPSKPKSLTELKAIREMRKRIAEHK